MNDMKIKVEEPHKTSEAVAKLFIEGMYGMTINEFALEIVRKIQRQQMANANL